MQELRTAFEKQLVSFGEVVITPAVLLTIALWIRKSEEVRGKGSGQWSVVSPRLAAQNRDMRP